MEFFFNNTRQQKIIEIQIRIKLIFWRGSPLDEDIHKMTGFVSHRRGPGGDRDRRKAARESVSSFHEALSFAFVQNCPEYKKHRKPIMMQRCEKKTPRGLTL